MTLLEAFFYGAIQGITEYLPVSSSAHLILFPHFLGTPDPGLAFDVFLHIGTLMATLLYFRKEWKALLSFQSPFLLKMIVIATVPALLAGALFHSWIEANLRQPSVLAVSLAVGGLALWLFDRLGKNEKTIGSLTWKDSLSVGLFQCLSLIPGVSRSGSTMMSARLFGYTREDAARFSFLLSAPITLAAIVFELRKFGILSAEITSQGGDGVRLLAIALISSFVFGWIAIETLLKVVKRYGYGVFALYRVILALVVWQFLV